jgi:hypothetical protein
MMDNRLFNVNGTGDDMLLLTLKLAGMQESSRPDCFAGWRYVPDFGMVLYWHTKAEEGIAPFMHNLTAEEVTPVVARWLKSSEEAKAEVAKLRVRRSAYPEWKEPAYGIEDPRSTWDLDQQHDGDNYPGWRVYCQNWGHVAGSHYSICAVRPAFMWAGK